MRRTGHVRNTMEEKCVTEDTLKTRRWKDTIKVNLKETWYTYVDWIHVAKERSQLLDVLNTIVKLRVP